MTHCDAGKNWGMFVYGGLKPGGFLGSKKCGTKIKSKALGVVIYKLFWVKAKCARIWKV